MMSSLTPSFLFESQRLGFRGWRGSDVAAMAAVNADPEVMRYFPATLPFEQTAAFVQRMQDMQAELQYCYFVLEHKASGEVMGFLGLCWQDYASPFTPATDIGWRLAKKFWGQGYATEGAQRCIRYAFDTLALTRLIATAPLVNTPSLRVMEKAGMKRVGKFAHPRLMGHPLLERVACYELRNTGRGKGL